MGEAAGRVHRRGRGVLSGQAHFRSRTQREPRGSRKRALRRKLEEGAEEEPGLEGPLPRESVWRPGTWLAGQPGRGQAGALSWRETDVMPFHRWRGKLCPVGT